MLGNNRVCKQVVCSREMLSSIVSITVSYEFVSCICNGRAKNCYTVKAGNVEKINHRLRYDDITVIVNWQETLRTALDDFNSIQQKLWSEVSEISEKRNPSISAEGHGCYSRALWHLSISRGKITNVTNFPMIYEDTSYIWAHSSD
jgi:hypothetical protein